MTRKHTLLAAIASLALSIPAARAADNDPWFELKNFGPVTHRVAVTVENPADVDVDSALVHIPMNQLRKADPDCKYNQVCVVDPAADRSHIRRDAAELNFIPSQVNQKTLIFALPLKAHESKKVYVYSAPERLNMPGFPPKTAWDNRKAYRSFENNIIAYRMETGPGANTMGLGIDSFGKTKKGQGLRLQEAYETGHDSYHKLAYWGVDILKVGYGPALGGIYVMTPDGKEQGRPHFATSFVDCLYSGPVETKLRCTAPVEVAGRKVTVTRVYTVWANDRTILSEDKVTGDNLDGLTIGIGLRDMPNPVWIEKPDPGYAISAGDSNQPESGYTSNALAAVFPQSGFTNVIDIQDKEHKPGFGDGGHIYVLKPNLQDGALTATNRLTITWNGDPQIPTYQDMEKWCQKWVAERDNPIKVTVATEAEKKE